MKVVRQARLELSGGSTPDQLRPFWSSCAEYNAHKDRAMAARPQIAGAKMRKAFMTATKMLPTMDLDAEVRAKFKVLKSPLGGLPSTSSHCITELHFLVDAAKKDLELNLTWMLRRRFCWMLETNCLKERLLGCHIPPFWGGNSHSILHGMISDVQHLVESSFWETK